MAESRRNPAVARIYQDMEADVRERFIALLRSAAERGEIRRDIDFDGTVTVLFALADGLSWRRAVEPTFNAEAVMPIVLDMVRHASQSGIGRRQQGRGQFMKGNRIAAVGLVVAAGAWIASGHLFPHETAESRAAVRPSSTRSAKLFRVSVMDAQLEPRSRSSCSPAAPRPTSKMMVTARADGIITELKVRRGQQVKQGDVIAVLSDEAREARVAQARAMLMQRKTELEARMKLVEQGTLPKLEAVNLETAVQGRGSRRSRRPKPSATAASSARRGPASSTTCRSRSGRRRSRSRARKSRRSSSLDPILAVVEVAERKLPASRSAIGAEIRLVTGHKAKGKVRFISKSASQSTRTYRVEVEVPNADGYIPDGITAEVAIPLAPVPATRVPRSALTFSSAGDLGVRIVDAANKVAFVPVSVVEDEQQFMWVGGVARRRARDRAGAGLRARRPGGRGGRTPSAPKTAGALKQFIHGQSGRLRHQPCAPDHRDARSSCWSRASSPM